MITRMFCSFIAGFILMLGGSLTQGVMQNELAGPSTLGLYAIVVCALLAAVILQIPWEWGSLAIFFVIYGLFYFLVNKNKKISSIFQQHFLLIGLSINLCIGAVLTFIKFIFEALNKPFPDYFWYGHFKYTEAQWLYFLIPLFLLSLIYTYHNKKKIQLISFGDFLPQSLGIDSHKIQISAILMSLFIVGSISCFFGIFSFTGVLFPQIIRGIKRYKNRLDLELAEGPWIVGLFFLILDQLLYYVNPLGIEFPMGIILSLLGGFLLTGLIFSGRRK